MNAGLPLEMLGLALAATSARWLVEAARDSGWTQIHALDAFGDLDTRARSTAWFDVACPRGAAQIDPQRLRSALSRLARGGIAGGLGGAPVAAWIDGPGCEAFVMDEPEGSTLPRWGAPAQAHRILRTPARWLQALAELGLPHPSSQLEVPADPRGWLRKDLARSGGLGVQLAQACTGDASAAPSVYWQRAAPGVPWSLCFLAGRDDILVLGAQRQDIAATAAHRWAFAGLHGPHDLPFQLDAAWADAARALARYSGLRGLASLDGLIDEATGHWQLLELNPRPSASLQLYRPWPVLRWHVQACRDGRLPSRLPERPAARHWRVIHAPSPMHFDAETCGGWRPQGDDALRAGLHLHDLPALAPSDPGGCVPSGTPICSLSLPHVAGPGPQSSAALLRALQAQLLNHLDPTCVAHHEFDPHEPAELSAQ